MGESMTTQPRRRAPAALRYAVGVLCVIGVFAGAQRTVMSVLEQPHGADGMTPILRANISTMERVIGVAEGTSRHEDLVSGSLAFETKYEKHRALILAHVIPGGVLFLLAPFQFSDRIRRRYPAYHRWTGRVLLVAVLISGLGAFAFGLFMPFAGWLESVAVALYGTLFVYAGARAWIAIRARDVTTHREWMTRMFAVAIGISATRLVSLPIGALFETLSFRAAFLWSLWTGFTVSVLVAEWVIRRARPRRAPVRLQAIATDIL